MFHCTELVPTIYFRVKLLGTVPVPDSYEDLMKRIDEIRQPVGEEDPKRGSLFRS